MLASTFEVQVAFAAAGEGFDPVGPIVIVASIVLAALLMTWIFRRRSKASLKAATGGDSDAFVFAIAPAPPWPDSVTVLRRLVGETSPEPRITRYSRPVVAVDARGLSSSFGKAVDLRTWGIRTAVLRT